MFRRRGIKDARGYPIDDEGQSRGSEQVDEAEGEVRVSWSEEVWEVGVYVREARHGEGAQEGVER